MESQALFRLACLLSKHPMFQRWSLTLLASLALTACGGGGDDTPSIAPPQIEQPQPNPPGVNLPTITPPVTPPSVTPPEAEIPALPPSAASRVAYALNHGDSRQLQPADQAALLQSAAQIMRTARLQQRAVLTQLLDASTAASLDFSHDSQTVQPQLSMAASPLLVADNGNVLASISAPHAGRALGYGKDLLGQLSSPSGLNQQQLPLFQRSFTWLVTGKARGTLPSNIRIATAGYSASSVSSLVARLGSKAEVVNCAIADTANNCWQELDVLVFGQGTPAGSTLSEQVERYLKAGKAVIYLHGNWQDSAGGRQVLQALGMQLGDYGGNWFAPAAGYQIGSESNFTKQLQATDRLASHDKLLAALLDAHTGNPTDFATDTSLVNALDGIRSDLLKLEGQGVNLFADSYATKPYTDAHRRLVLWADLVRQQVDYSQVRRSNAEDFLRTLAADTLSYAVRISESTPRNFGDWMPATSPSLATSANWENIEVTIAQEKGRTAIGRGAVPGKMLEVEIVNAAGANLALRVGQIRTRGNPLAQENYTRPRFPDGHQARLTAGKTLSYSTAWGGPLFLDYANAQPGSTVTLRVRGSTKYAHFDFTRNPSPLEIDEAVQALQRADFGWQTSKMVGGEVQQTIGYAQSAIGNYHPKVYVVDRLKGMIFDSNHLANGYNNLQASANVNSLCTQLGWDCVSNVHRAPDVQHFVGWLAACGFLCSGNPSDGATGLSPGWGWWHELGHNTVPRHMSLTFPGGGCGGECNNNILANASALRQYTLTQGAENNNGASIDHRKLYQDIQAAHASGKTGADLRDDMFSRFWVGPQRSDNAMRAVHFQLAFFYTRERLGQAQPQASDVIDFLGLLSRGNRLVDKQWSLAHRASLGMALFENNQISNHELLYVLSSRIIGRDMRQLFSLYGIPLGDQALGSISALNLPQLTPAFYAMVPGQGNQLERGQWLNLSSGIPSYPF